jgi:hypothetical protein
MREIATAPRPLVRHASRANLARALEKEKSGNKAKSMLRLSNMGLVNILERDFGLAKGSD